MKYDPYADGGRRARRRPSASWSRSARPCWWMMAGWCAMPGSTDWLTTSCAAGCAGRRSSSSRPARLPSGGGARTDRPRAAGKAGGGGAGRADSPRACLSGSARPARHHRRADRLPTIPGAPAPPQLRLSRNCWRWARCQWSTRTTRSPPRKSASVTTTGSPPASRRWSVPICWCCSPTSTGSTPPTRQDRVSAGARDRRKNRRDAQAPRRPATAPAWSQARRGVSR